MVAGEASGDVLGAEVLAALRQSHGDRLHLAGLGGPRMAAQGLTSLFPMADVAVMGLVAVLWRYGRLMQRLALLKREIEAFSPDVLLLIDAQELAYRLGRHFAGAPFRRVQLVAPTVWAWKPERAAKVAKYLDHIACLFPFEPPYFAAEGLAASFVGHPSVATSVPISYEQARGCLGIPPGQVWAALLPGSRSHEVAQLAPRFARAAQQAWDQGLIYGALIPVASTVAPQVYAWAANLPFPYKILETPDEQALLPAADLALAASGTVSLELSAQGIASILAYQFDFLTYFWIRSKFTANYMGLTNLLAGREIQSEFRINEGTEAAMIAAFMALAASPEQRTHTAAAQTQALEAMRLDDGQDFGARVAAMLEPVA